MVVFTPTFRAIAPLAAYFPPAPASAFVVAACSPVAIKLRESALINSTAPSTSALAVLTPTLRAKEAPPPTLLLVVVLGDVCPLVSLALAKIVAELLFSAVKLTSPPRISCPASTLEVLVNTASLLVMPVLIANDPAKPSLPAPAPEVALAPRVCLLSSESRLSINASMVSP